MLTGGRFSFGFLAFAVPGVVVARRQPGNPIGWILIGLGVYAGVITDVGRYAVFDYHFHRGDLPFGPAAALLETGLWTGTFLMLPLVISPFSVAACRGAGGWCCGPTWPTPPWSPRTSSAPPRGR